MAQKLNKKRREVEYQVGDWVLLKLQPYRQSSVAKRVFHKLSKRYYGPFEVVERIRAVAYRLNLPSHSLVHPVFHVSLLKPYRGSEDSILQDLPSEFLPKSDAIQPFSICAVRRVLRKGLPELQVLIHWHGSSSENAV